MAYLVNVKNDEQEVECKYPNTLRCILDSFQRLAEYEDTGFTPEGVINLKAALAATKAMYDVVCDAEEKTVLLEKLNACRAEIVGVQATLWNIRAACEKHRDPLYGFSPLELEILAILGIELGSKKAVFEWCPKCKFYKNCYGDPDAINPKYLEPRCGEGPVLEEIGG